MKRALVVFVGFILGVGGVEAAAVAARCWRRLACPRRMEEEGDDGLVLHALTLSSSSLPRMLEQRTSIVLPRTCAGGPFRSDARVLLTA